MPNLEVQVARVRGICNSKLEEGDSFLIRWLHMAPPRNGRFCNVAFASIIMNVGRLALQEGPIHISCPDPGTGDGGNVVFRLSLAGGQALVDSEWVDIVRPINIRPVEIIGGCPAGLTLDDQFQIKGMRLENPRQGALCLLAFGNFPWMVWQLQSGSRFFSHSSCPGCTAQLEHENRVVFLLGHADKWELCEIISEYRQLCRRWEETQAARQLRVEAMGCQDRGDYSGAAQKMRAALEELKRVAAFSRRHGV